MRTLVTLAVIILLGWAAWAFVSGENSLLTGSGSAPESAGANPESSRPTSNPSDTAATVANDGADGKAVATGSDGPSPAGTTDTSSSGTDPTQTTSSAQAFVKKLTGDGNNIISASNADHFVTGTQELSIDVDRKVERTTLRKLKLDPDLAPTAPITVVKEVPEIDLSSPEELIADVGGDLSKTIKILVNDEVKTLSVREVLTAHAAGSPEEPISIIKNVEYLEPTTVRALIESLGGGQPESQLDQLVRVIKAPYRPDSASIGDLLAGLKGVDEDTIFYVHSVKNSDGQGVWGIIHDGLIRNFARGMAVRRGEQVDRFQIDIPQDADERKVDNSSSYLGKLIDDKARSSTVYNFKAGRMTQNPDLLLPGNEIVIINFAPDELVDIYRHFLSVQPNAG